IPMLLVPINPMANFATHGYGLSENVIKMMARRTHRTALLSRRSRRRTSWCRGRAARPSGRCARDCDTPRAPPSVAGVQLERRGAKKFQTTPPVGNLPEFVPAVYLGLLAHQRAAEPLVETTRARILFQHP